MLVISTRCSSRGCEVMSSVMDRAYCLRYGSGIPDVEGQMHHMVASFIYTNLESRNCFGGADPVADLHHRVGLPLTNNCTLGSAQQSSSC